MSQVLLINPPYFFAKDGTYLSNKEVWKPLGLLYLGAVLKKEGITVEVLDLMPQESNFKKITAFIKENKPKIVGLTGTTPQVRGLVQLGRQIKKIFGKKIVLGVGGSHVSCDPTFVKSFPFFDFALIGEGEITFPKLVKEILAGKSFKKIIYGEPPLNLDELPFPARELLNDENYANGPYGRHYATVHTTRGCPFRCIFCSSPVERIAKVRYRSPENVVDEIEFCFQKYGAKFFIFTDDTFTLNEERVKEICRQVLKRELRIKWNCETRASLINEGLLRTMKKAGCVEIFFGVESGSERVRNEIINKKISNADLYRAFEICRKLGITTNAFLMAGFPTETKKELQETADFVFKAKPDIIGIHLTVILPGSEIFDLAVRQKKIKKDFWSQYAQGKIKDQPVYVPEGLTLTDLEDFQKSLYRKFYFRPKWIFRRLKTSFSSFNQLKSDLLTGWQLLTKGKSKARSYKEEDYFK
jgi:radical SAM superfamily enzyme YgiQ (UPF0313 family)